ncbi:MAG: hypothetical protein JWM88_3142 [Verrucomicrobia bacterium]|nr:hypothetical protein [Verrucomicrobiota bacterium]
MKNRTRQLYVISPGLSSGVAFVSWDSGEDPYQRASDFMPDVDHPVEKRQGLQRNWTQAIKHLPKVWTRLVRPTLRRQATKPASV